jgi:Na+-translocating ferredoxin:NAD+ oxidoreductase RnfD subunit
MEVLLVGLYLSFTRPKLRNQAVTVIGTQSVLVFGSILIGVLLRIPLEPWLGRTAGSLSAALIAVGLYGGLILVINTEIRQFVVRWIGKVLGR